MDTRKIVWGLIATSMVLTPLYAKEGVSRNELKELIGESYVMSQDNPNALKEYQDILKANPGDLKARTRIADILSWQKKYEASIVEYKKVLAASPEDIAVQKKLADVYVWQGNYAEAMSLYQEIASRYPKDPKIALALANTMLHLGKTAEAKILLKGVLLKDPENTEAQALLADLHATEGDFGKAISLYQKAIARKYDRKVKMKIGDIQSWARNYRDALKIYDELLAEKDEKEVRLQKARVLGWERKYRQAKKEYQKILEKWPDELVREERDAKELYWDNRVQRAISAYQQLIQKAPENTEAMFDLSQLYAYQGMWHEAIEQYHAILGRFAGHFRAREGLKKAELISTHSLLSSGYEFFRARSSARDVDIRKNTLTELLSIPLNLCAVMDLGYALTRRSFLNHRDLTEHKGRVAVHYQRAPAWSTGAFFDLTSYYKGIAPVYEFGGQFTFRTLDVGQMTLSQEQQRLENNSTVLERRLFRNNFKVREDLDLAKRWKAGTDYTFSYFSDHNQSHEMAADTLYYLSLEPQALYVKYRYAFRDFRKIEADYFSPQEYSLHTISVRWKHFLNKTEVFFGANDLYYEAGYDVSFDSTGITSHQVSGGLTWDVNKRLQIKGGGQYTIASSKIYEDVGAKGSVKYFF